jgi:hypothetical protein
MILGTLLIFIVIFADYIWSTTSSISEDFAILPEWSVRAIIRSNRILDSKNILKKLPFRLVNDPTKYTVIPLESEKKSKMPTQIYEGESELIILRPQLEQWKEHDSLLAVNLISAINQAKTTNLKSQVEFENYAVLQHTKQKFTKVLSKGDQAQFLTIELLAPGFSVDGEKKQYQNLQNKNLIYSWGITANNSGNHTIGFTLKLESKSGNDTIQLGTMMWKIKVVSLFHLTKRQLRILFGSIGALTTILTILQALKELGVIP